MVNEQLATIVTLLGNDQTTASRRQAWDVWMDDALARLDTIMLDLGKAGMGYSDPDDGALRRQLGQLIEQIQSGRDRLALAQKVILGCGPERPSSE